jgi:LPXTG-motif cell wall-anchored protein
VKARVSERKDEAVSAAHQRVDRARSAAADSAVAAKDTARENPGLIAGAAAALLVLLVLLVRRRRR